jgi:hypothetical protein
MKRLLLGMAPTLVLLAGIGCKGDPTGDLQNGMDHLTATPSQMFLQPGESKTVIVSGFDAQGNPQPADYVVTDPGTNITVKRDSTFLPDYVNDSTLQAPATAPTFRFIVTSTGYGATSFTVTAQGKSVTVPVQNAATTVLDAQVSDTQPALGEVVTITLPAGVSFSPTTTVTLADTLAVQPFAVTIAPDNKSLTFLPPPNMTSAQLVISDVVSDAVPGAPFSPVTAQRFTTPQLTLLNATISNLAPAALQQITVSIIGGATFDPSATFSIGNTDAVLLNLTSTVATLLPIPGTSGILTAHGVIPDSLPQYVLPLVSTDTVTAGALTPLVGTDDPATAPTITGPTTLNDVGSFDYDNCGAAAGFPCQVYKLHVASASTFQFTLNGYNPADLGLYFLNPVTLAQLPQVCDNNGRASPPESCSLSFAAGDYIMGVVTFGPGYPENDPNPLFITVTIQ